MSAKLTATVTGAGYAGAGFDSTIGAALARFGADVPAGADRRNAMMNNPLNTVGEWYDAVEDHNIPYPLCRVAGELNFTLDHNPAQCQVAWDEGRCRKLSSDEKCCAPPGRQACADLIGGTGDVVETYQLVETGEACKDENGNDSLEFKCYKCEAASARRRGG